MRVLFPSGDPARVGIQSFFFFRSVSGSRLGLDSHSGTRKPTLTPSQDPLRLRIQAGMHAARAMRRRGSVRCMHAWPARALGQLACNVAPLVSQVRGLLLLLRRYRAVVRRLLETHWRPGGPRKVRPEPQMSCCAHLMCASELEVQNEHTIAERVVSRRHLGEHPARPRGRWRRGLRPTPTARGPAGTRSASCNAANGPACVHPAVRGL